MEIGPFETEITGYRYIDFYGVEKVRLDQSEETNNRIELLRLMYDDVKDSDEETGERSFTDGTLTVVWKLKIESSSEGIDMITPIVLRVYGNLTIEDLPEGADPSNMDIELIDYNFKFDSEGTEFALKFEPDGESKIDLTHGFKATYVQIHYEEKKVLVMFGE
jgi:hypothetical protein